MRISYVVSALSSFGHSVDGVPALSGYDHSIESVPALSRFCHNVDSVPALSGYGHSVVPSHDLLASDDSDADIPGV
jgi:hypothetical protein